MIDMLTIEIKKVDLKIPENMNRVNDDRLWLYAASEWHRFYRDYVPFDEGALYSSVIFQKEEHGASIKHTVPYAHYMYEGMVMGPNIPLSQGGAIVGYFSPVKPKHYTGAMIHYQGMGSRHWDEAAAPAKLPLLKQSVQDYINHMRF